ncbi:MAG: hypothetical protein ACRD0K_28610 [Egibacteraceae bacterium]
MRVRPAEPGDHGAIRRLFRATLAGGQPLPFAVPGLAGYEALCLDWYLGPGLSAAAVAEDMGTVVGYALVCLDERSHRRWARRRAVVWAGRAVVSMARRSTSPTARTFLWLRIADGLAAWSAGRASPMPAHAHLNIASGARRGVAAARLVGHIDDVCARHGATGWYGEINTRGGRRATALERLVGEVVHQAPNRTLSWLAGEPVQRLTLVRTLNSPDRRSSVSSGVDDDAYMRVVET